jgi:hypothetical protein
MSGKGGPSRKDFYDYDRFVNKFKPKKTTDDCYTPPAVYDAVLGYVIQRYGIDASTVVSPFYPGGDYEHFDYTGKVVVDNPPFSILSQIITFYIEHDIKFFLFAPGLLMLALASKYYDRFNRLCAHAQITYENGASVNTGFVTNLADDGIVLETCPELRQKIMDAQAENGKASRPTYRYPDNVITSALCNKYASHGIRFQVPAAECARISALDEQKAVKKDVYGGGFLLSDRLATQIREAETACQTAPQNAPHVWKLSERELEIVARLNDASSGDRDGSEG